jgi:hypothetical protein
MHSLYILFSVLFFVTPATYGQTTFTTFASGKQSYDRFLQWQSALTKLQPDGVSRTVHSSGGAAGGIVSEGQGYGVFLGAANVIALGPSDSRYSTALSTAYSLFKGWKAMCKGSTVGSPCQSPYYCLDSGTYYPCLPHWKFNDQLGNWEYGSATDGDIDGIAGMALLTAATASNKPTWWNEVAEWTYSSCKQFYDSAVEEKTVGSVVESILKLGSCWGGLSCSNPSYFAPGHYRLLRNWMGTYGPALGKSASEISSYQAKYDKLIKSTYKIISSNQNDAGLTTNWYIPNQADLSQKGTISTSCGGSGTPIDQYGAEAARGVWRVSVDFIWFKSAESKTYLDKVAKQLSLKFTGSTFSNLDTGDFVKSVFDGWLSNAFIYGPTFCALVDKVSTLTNQDAAIAKAKDIISGATISDYYAGSWVAISTITLSGDLAKAASLAGGSPPPPVAPVAVPPVAAPVTAPVAAPVAPVDPSTRTCTIKGCSINMNYIEFVTSTTGVTSAKVLCSDGRTIPCTAVNTGNNGKYTCSVTDSKSCINPIPQINGAECRITIPNSGKTCASGNTNPWWVEFVPPVTTGLNVNLASVKCSDGRIQSCADGGGKLNCPIKENPCSNPIPIYDGSYCPFPASALVSDGDSLTSTNQFPVWAIGIIAAGCFVVIIVVVITITAIRKRRQTQEIV